MSAILLPAPSTATPTLQRLNSRSMLRNLSSSDDHALARKTHHHRHHEDEHAESSHWLAPPLAPKVMEPERHSKAADATVRLQRIEYVEVADVIQREGDNKHYYVVHVYLKQEQSRIPTNQSRFQRVLRSGHHEARRTPDFTIERRFSEFEQLRKEMWTTVQHSHRHYCTFCDSFMFLLLFSSAQPGVLAKTVLKSPEMRAKLLDKFLHNVVDQFQRNRPRCRIACYSLGHLPLVLHDFLFGGDEHEPRASVVSDASDASVDPTE